MTLRDLFADTFRTLWAHKLRTALTMFGIAWGVVSITLMVAAGEGLRAGQKKQTENLGKDLMIVFAGRTSLQAGGTRAGRKLYWRASDPEAIEREAAACRHVLPELGRGGIPRPKLIQQRRPSRYGIAVAVQDIRSIGIGEGRFYNWEDHRATRRVAVLGSDARKQLFGSRNALGETVHIAGRPYTVVGVMEFKEQDSAYDGRDVSKVFVPFPAMIRDFPNVPPRPPDSIDQLLAAPQTPEQHEQCRAQIARALGRMHRFDPADKEAVPVWDTVEEVSKLRALTDGMKYFLGAVGVVTLFLGGIGVMNVMLVAVRERTREIGVRKAVGATRGSILAQFFAETLLIVVVSGGFGMAVAYGFCAAVNTLPMPPFFAGLQPTAGSSMLSVALLGFVAIGAAMYPASRAASVDPIEALRYEAGG